MAVQWNIIFIHVGSMLISQIYNYNKQFYFVVQRERDRDRDRDSI